MPNHSFAKAKQVLQALIQGVDPESGSELYTDTIMNRVDVMRALMAAVAAIDVVVAKNARRAMLPPQVGTPWTDEEESQLKEEFRRKKPIDEIAAAHGRTVRSIEARLQKLGLAEPKRGWS